MRTKAIEVLERLLATNSCPAESIGSAMRLIVDLRDAIGDPRYDNSWLAELENDELRAEVASLRQLADEGEEELSCRESDSD